MHNKHQLPAPALPSSRSGLLFVVLSLAMASNAIADQPQTGGVKNDRSDRSAEAGDQSGMGLVVGDRLKIVFYSRVGSGSDGANTGVSDLLHPWSNIPR